MKNMEQKVKSAILGFAVGDALGVPVEFCSRESLQRDPVSGMRAGGTHGQPAGTWSDDTSMTLCVLTSLTQRGVDCADQMTRFSEWIRTGSYTARGNVFDYGGTTIRTIRAFERGIEPAQCGESGDYSCGNGSLMRMAPVALYLFGKYGCTQLDDCAAEMIHRSSACTHAHPRCLMACGVHCAVMFQLLEGKSPKQAVEQGVETALAYYREKHGFSEVYGDFENLTGIAAWEEAQIRGSGYVLHTLQASLWCLLHTGSYAACVCKAVNLGEDTDTTAAVAGSLAGLWYSENGIPAQWAAVTASYEEIGKLCEAFSRSLSSAS